MNHMNHFPADLASRSAGVRSGDRASHDRKNSAGAGRMGFSRPVWPFLVAAKRDHEKPQVSGHDDLRSFSS